MKAPVKGIAAMAAMAAVIIPAATPASAAANVPFTNSVVDRVVGAGSDTTYFIMNDLANAYMESEGCLLNPVTITSPPPNQNECQAGAGNALAGDNVYENYDHDVVVNYFPQGSGAGNIPLCKATPVPPAGRPYLDFSRSSSGPSAPCNSGNGGQAGTVLRFIAFARDALTWTKWNGAGGGTAVTNLTQAQLRDIFITCAITDWGQVGGEAGEPIRVFTALDTSGSRAVWQSFLGGGDSSACIPAQYKDGSVANGEREIREHQQAEVEVAQNDPDAALEENSIFFTSVGIYNTQPSAASNAVLGSVNGIAPTAANIQNGTFPFTRLLYNVIRQSGPAPLASTATRRFLGCTANANSQTQGWITKADGAHSKPLTDPGPGIPDANSSRNYAQLKASVFADNGFFQLPPNAQGNRCTFTDITIV